mmetsp:Transcript_496/g.1010  ORF Transcript_496/g.1010 Transcript_496/m.1010 type:complete len:95 (-) Transcript_496:1177-1461(-)
MLGGSGVISTAIHGKMEVKPGEKSLLPTIVKTSPPPKSPAPSTVGRMTNVTFVFVYDASGISVAMKWRATRSYSLQLDPVRVPSSTHAVGVMGG